MSLALISNSYFLESDTEVSGEEDDDQREEKVTNDGRVTNNSELSGGKEKKENETISKFHDVKLEPVEPNFLSSDSKTTTNCNGGKSRPRNDLGISNSGVAPKPTIKIEPVLTDSDPTQRATSDFEVISPSSHLSIAVREEETFKCPYCLLICHGSDELIQHLPTHIGSGRTVEGVAENATQQIPVGSGTEKVLIQESSTPTHKRAHYKCAHCITSFEDLDGLTKHMRQHEKPERPWKCSTCSSSFATSSHLRRHENRLHGGRRVGSIRTHPLACHARHPTKKGCHNGKTDNGVLKSHKCDICNLLFNQQYKLNKHNRIHKDGADRPWQCARCHSFFRTKSHLKYHETRTHSDGEPIREGPVSCVQCSKCSARFTTRSKLRQHMEIHKERADRPWKCSKCPSFFKTSRNLRMHENRAHDRKIGKTKTVCYFCKRVLLSSHLERHIRTHTDERPFGCPRCDRTFKQKYDAIKHLMSVHGQKRATARLKVVDCASSSKEEASRRGRDILDELPPCKLVLKRCDDIISAYTNAGSDVIPGFVAEARIDPGMETQDSSLKKISKVQPQLNIESRKKEPRKIIHKGICTKEVGLGSKHRNDFVVRKQAGQNIGASEHKSIKTKNKMDTSSQSQCKERWNKDVGERHHEERTETVTVSDPGSKSEEEKKIYNCPFCLESFVESSLLIGHLPTHTGKPGNLNNTLYSNDQECCRKQLKKVPCSAILASNVINKSSVRNSALPKDFSRAAPMKNSKHYRCTHCSYSCLFDKALQQHMKQHSEVGRPFKCSQCKYTFTTFKSLRIHEGRFHKGSKNIHIPKPTYKCKHCSYSSKILNNFRLHMKLHEVKGRPFKCVRCNFTFTTFKSLRIHEGRYHKGSKPLQITAVDTVHKCQRCKYTTSILRDWENHVVSHKKVDRKPFKCSLCDCYFQDFKELRIHTLRLHSIGTTPKQDVGVSPIRLHSKLNSSVNRLKNVKVISS